MITKNSKKLQKIFKKNIFSQSQKQNSHRRSKLVFIFRRSNGSQKLFFWLQILFIMIQLFLVWIINSYGMLIQVNKNSRLKNSLTLIFVGNIRCTQAKIILRIFVGFVIILLKDNFSSIKCTFCAQTFCYTPFTFKICTQLLLIAPTTEKIEI